MDNLKDESLAAALKRVARRLVELASAMRTAWGEGECDARWSRASA